MKTRCLTKENYKNINLKFVALVINPILALFFALKELKSKTSYNLLFLLSIIFGSSLTVANVRTEQNNFDGIGYRIEFENYVKLTNSDFIRNFNNYINFTGDTDFFDDIFYFIVSRVTDNYHVMYMLLAIIFSFFLLKSLKYFVLEDNFSNSLVSFILLYLFLSNQIININMFRFYIALWITVYTLLKVFIFKKLYNIFFLLIIPFIHASFFLLFILIPLYCLIKKDFLLKPLFIISLVVSGFSIELLQQSAGFLPDTIGVKVLAYTDENYMYIINESGSGFIWIKRMVERISVGYINFLVFVMMFNYKINIKNTKCQSLFLFLVLLMSFVNFTLFIPSVGSRFIMMALPFIAYIWLTCFHEIKFNKYIYGLGIIFVIHAIFPFNIYQFPCLRHYGQLLESSFWINSPLVSFVKYIFW